MSTPFHNADGTPMTPDETKAQLIAKLDGSIENTLAVLVQALADPSPGWIVRSAHGVVISYDEDDAGKPVNARPASVGTCAQFVSEQVAATLAAHTHDATGAPMRAVRADHAAAQELQNLVTLRMRLVNDESAAPVIAEAVERTMAEYEARKNGKLNVMSNPAAIDNLKPQV